MKAEVGAKPNKGPRIEIPTRPEVGEERQVREEPGQWAKERESGQLERETQRERLAKGDAEGQSTTDSRRDQSGEIENYTSAIVYRCTGNAVSQLTLLAL